MSLLRILDIESKVSPTAQWVTSLKSQQKPVPQNAIHQQLYGVQHFRPILWQTSLLEACPKAKVNRPRSY